MSDTRIESDSLGQMHVPAGALYGAQTARAVENFPVSGWRMPRRFLQALGLIKKAAATVHQAAGRLGADQAGAIIQAADEVADGTLDAHFPVDVFQTGSGTSTNMNANEVIANRAVQLLGGSVGEKSLVHPNDHVNLAQSSNDVIPSAMQLAAALAIREELLQALGALEGALAAKAAEFDDVVKIGRTHLMDAVPVRLGQEFAGYAAQIRRARRAVTDAMDQLGELAMGGTAVGTGLNAPAGFGGAVCRLLAEWTGLRVWEAGDHFEVQAARDVVVHVSGVLRATALAMGKIASDIRLMGSGPRCGLGELLLPATQPGSSIMPGKVNPVICESVIQVVCQVVGCDAAIAAGATGGIGGILELNVAMPMMAWNLLTAIELLSRAAEVFRTRCVEGLQADRKRCEELVEHSLAMVTVLAPRLGYDRAADLAKQAHATGRTIRELCLEQGVLEAGELVELLDARRQTKPAGA